jgi:hypothetical protein
MLLNSGAPAPHQEPFQLQREIRGILSRLRPHKVVGYEKVRIGAAGDGGYVCLNDFDGIDIALSFGIEWNPAWDIAVADRGVVVHQFDHTVEDPRPDDPRMHFNKVMIGAEHADGVETLDRLIQKHDAGRERPNIFLKIDIENWEWPVFDAVDPALLGRIAQVTGEFHAFEFMVYPEWRERTARAINKITEQFALVHAHANNYAGCTNLTFVPLPNVMEFTFVNKAMYDVEPSDELFPGPLDTPCRPDIPDFWLGAFRF